MRKDNPTASDVHVDNAGGVTTKPRGKAKLYSDVKKVYGSIDELPATVKDKLKGDETRQRQWMHVFNSSMSSHKDESRAFAEAWSTVNDQMKKFVKAESINPALGVVLGWAIVCKEDGQDYWDVQKNHIPEDSMLEAAADFMEHSRAGNEMHAGPDVGTYVFAFPLTTEIAKAMGITCKRSGLMVGYKPPPEVLAKFISGEYTGFSIEGEHINLEAPK